MSSTPQPGPEATRTSARSRLGDRAIAFLADIAHRLEADEAVSLGEQDRKWFEVAAELRPDELRQVAGAIIHNAPSTSDVAIAAAKALTRAEPIEHIEGDRDYVTNFATLASASPTLRPVAISALARHPGREAVDALVSILHDTDDRSVRAETIEAITQHPLSDEACSLVLDQFIVDRSAIPKETALAANPDVRIGRIDKGELSTLLGAVRDPQRAQEISRELLRSLSHRGRAVAVEHFVPETSADVAKLGRRVRSIIARANRPARSTAPQEAVATHELGADPAFDGILTAIGRHPEAIGQAWRYASEHELSSSQRAVLDQALTEVLARAHDLDSEITIESLFTAMGRHPEAVEQLWRFTSVHELTSSQRQALAEALAATGDPRAATHLVALARWEQAVETPAAPDLDAFDDDAPIAIPDAPITTDDATVAVALRAAGAIASPETDDLLQRFATNEDPALRAAALDGIARRLDAVDDPEGLQRFASLAADALESASPEVRGAALRALAHPSLPVDDALVASALAIVDDAECPPSAARGAIAALARIKDEHGEPHPALRRLAASDERRADVMEVLKTSEDIDVLARLTTDDGLAADPAIALELLTSLRAEEPEVEPTLATPQGGVDLDADGGVAVDEIPGAHFDDVPGADLDDRPGLPPGASQADLGIADHEGRRPPSSLDDLPDHFAETRHQTAPRPGLLDEHTILEPREPGGDVPDIGRDLGLGFGPGSGLGSGLGGSGLRGWGSL